MIEVEVRHLTKQYENHLAIDDISFSIETGKIYGFLGPNGAGKSTTMNIIAGCLAATSGDVLIENHDIFEEQQEAKRHIGYLPELPPLYLDMTPREYLAFVCEIKRVSKAERAAAINENMRRTGLLDVANRQIGQLSKGYRQRVGIAQALVGNPEVIVLDEPTVGLDPAQIVEIRELVRALGKDHTVLLSSHILSEVSELCDEVLILSKGKLVARDGRDFPVEGADDAARRLERQEQETQQRRLAGAGRPREELEGTARNIEGEVAENLRPHPVAQSDILEVNQWPTRFWTSLP